MRGTIGFLLIAGLICTGTSQNLNQPNTAGGKLVKGPQKAPPPVPGQQNAKGTGPQTPQQPAAGNPATGSQSAGNPPATGTGNQPPATGTGPSQPVKPPSGPGNPPATGAGKQPAATGTGTGHQPPATGTGPSQPVKPPSGPGNPPATGAGKQPAATGAGPQQPAAGPKAVPPPASGNQTGQNPSGAGSVGNPLPNAQPTTQPPAPTTTTTTTPVPTTTTTTTAKPKASNIVKKCPPDWDTHAGACYKMFQKGKKDFYAAEKVCNANKGNLVSVNNGKEYKYLMDTFMKKLPGGGGIVSVWIGLYCKDGTDFFWTDGSDAAGKALYRPTLMYFKRNKKVSTITLSTMGTMNGYYGVPMTKTLPFICEITLGGKKKSDKGTRCGYGWKIFKGRCYRMFYDRSRFFAAERTCNQYNGHLVSLTTDKEHKFVRKLFKTSHSNYGPWVGMTNIKNASPPTFAWTDGSATDYTPPHTFNGLPKPNPFFGMLSKNNTVLDVTPYFKLPYICERGVPKGCPKGWDRFQDFCYAVAKSPSTFKTALTMCRKFKSTLVSVCSMPEFKHMMRIRLMYRIKSFWTGAYFMRTGKKSQELVWSDRRGCSYYPPGKYETGFNKHGILSAQGLKRADPKDKHPFMCKIMAKNACLDGFKKIYQHDDPLLLVTSAADIHECKKACLEKDGCDGVTFAEYQGNKMCYLHHEDGGQLPMMTSVDLQHWKLCRNY